MPDSKAPVAIEEEGRRRREGGGEEEEGERTD